MRQNTVISFYELKDGDELMIEFCTQRGRIIESVRMPRTVALDLAYGILDTLGEYD